MYRQVVALSIHRNRPGLDVRAATPEEAGREIVGFHPHLLVHNDTAPSQRRRSTASPSGWRCSTPIL
jgi:hypothetical protein